MARILIIGATGFAGKTMLRMLSGLGGDDVFGTYRHSTCNRDLSWFFNKARLYECDVNEISSIEAVINAVKPDIIFHFAAYVSVFGSIGNPASTFRINVMGTINLLEAVKKIAPSARVLLPGSAEQYGLVTYDEMPIKEGHSLNPENPYAISKKIQEEVGLYYFKQFGINLYFTRTFHCTGPFQPAGFVCSDIARQIVSYERGGSSSIRVGNMDAKRDFTDMRDVALAYWNVINDGVPGYIYNVCSGESIQIKVILDKLISLSGRQIPMEIDSSKLRKADVPDFIGDNSRLKKLGWHPKYSIEQSLLDLLESARISYP